jgi:hypothetical protein
MELSMESNPAVVYRQRAVCLALGAGSPKGSPASVPPSPRQHIVDCSIVGLHQSYGTKYHVVGLFAAEISGGFR